MEMATETEIWKGVESGVIVETGTSVKIHLYDSCRGIQQPRLIYEKIIIINIQEG